MFRSRVILENERGQYSSTAPFLFLRVPLLRKQTVPRRIPLGSWRIAERFVILGREVFARVDFDFSFLGYLSERALRHERLIALQKT